MILSDSMAASKITINELADMAHVAKSSVSKALNGQPGVSEETRSRILKLAKELNFQPDSSARALAQSKTGAIAFVLPHDTTYSLADEYWTGMLSAVSEIISKHSNHILLISPSDTEASPFSTLEPLLRSRAVDGLIIGAEQLDAKSMMTVMMQEIPFVFIGKNPLINHYCVDIDNVGGAYDVVQKLIQRGYKRIGCISGPAEYMYVQERVNGFKKSMESSNLDGSHIVSCSYKKEETIEITKKFLESYPDTDALFITGGGEFILNIIDTVEKNKKKKDKLGFAGFDDTRYFDFLNQTIITAKQPIHAMGNAAAEMLYELIDGRTPQKREIVLPVEIIIR